MAKELQLRLYRIADGHLADFESAWRAGVLPLRLSRGFDIEAWTVPDESTFVWLVGYDGPEGFDAADAAYYAGPERAALDPDPAQWIVDNRTMWLRPVELTQ